MSERSLARIVRIDSIETHPNADSLEIAIIGGWRVVVKKEIFKAGEYAVYAEVDSWIPTVVASFLSKGKEPKEFGGVKGERLRTIRLRQELSQGLLMPLNELHLDGLDVTEWFGILKYEKPLAACLSGVARGNFPSFIRKTDQPRIQNLKRQFVDSLDSHELWHVSEKIDGSSMTVYFNNRIGEESSHYFGVCSRNLDLKFTEENSFWNMAVELGLEDKMHNFDTNIAIQGELIGPGIQGNPYKLQRPEFRVFDVYDIDKQTYVKQFSDDPEELTVTSICDLFCLQQVPMVSASLSLNFIVELLGNGINSILKFAEGLQEVNSFLSEPIEREGLVFTSLSDPNVSFKAINNSWLMLNE